MKGAMAEQEGTCSRAAPCACVGVRPSTRADCENWKPAASDNLRERIARIIDPPAFSLRYEPNVNKARWWENKKRRIEAAVAKADAILALDTQNRIPADDAENRMAMSDHEFDQLMDDSQVIYRMQAGDIVSQADVDALNRLDTHWRKNADDAVAAYAEGIKTGWQMAGGAEVADLLEKLDMAEATRATDKAMQGFKQALFVRALLDNVREEIRPEVEYALELASATVTAPGTLTPAMLVSPKARGEA